MSSALTNPLQAILQQASARPATSADLERARHRTDTAGAGSEVVLLCDTSSSMAEAAGDRTKYDHLQEAADSLRQALPSAVIIAFSTTAAPAPGALPRPSGSTALDLGLQEAARYRPARTIVISDGEPNSEDAALAAAAVLPGRIDVIYCGRDNNARALAFMRRLAAAGAGTVVVRDLVRLGTSSLPQDVRRLALPPAGGAR